MRRREVIGITIGIISACAMVNKAHMSLSDNKYIRFDLKLEKLVKKVQEPEITD